MNSTHIHSRRNRRMAKRSIAKRKTFKQTVKWIWWKRTRIEEKKTNGTKEKIKIRAHIHTRTTTEHYNTAKPSDNEPPTPLESVSIHILNETNVSSVFFFVVVVLFRRVGPPKFKIQLNCDILHSERAPPDEIFQLFQSNCNLFIDCVDGHTISSVLKENSRVLETKVYHRPA